MKNNFSWFKYFQQTMCFCLLLLSGNLLAQSVTFNYTGSTQQYIVPAGVTSLKVKANGASGADATTGGKGGNGAYIESIISVIPGDVLYVVVGGTNGYNGGGKAGKAGDIVRTRAINGGNGGGASDVRKNDSTLTGRVVVAGGGGGGGGFGYRFADNSAITTGGNGGKSNTAGEDGAESIVDASTTTTGGKGGAIGVGGAKGVGCNASVSINAHAGLNDGTGGCGPYFGFLTNTPDGGGGGGGYVVGGGGGSGAAGTTGCMYNHTSGGGGGAGGSNYTNPSDVNLVVTDGANSGNGSITISPIPIVTTNNAIQQPNNSVVLNGTVVDLGLTLTSGFEFGTDSTSLTNFIAATTGGSITAGAGSTPISVTLSAPMVVINTKYFYRALAVDGTDTTRGAILNFTIVLPTSIVSIKKSTPTDSMTNAGIVTFKIKFTDSIGGLTKDNFSITKTGISGDSIISVIGSDSIWNVQVYTGTGSGSIGLSCINGVGLTHKITSTLPYAGETFTIDKTAPTLTSVNIKSNNKINYKAKVGDIVTLSFTASEKISNPTVSIRGNSVTPSNVSGNDWTAPYMIQSSDLEAAITFNISFTDLVGNSGTSVSATSDNSAVLIDKTIPTISSITISSNNSMVSKAKVGDNIILLFTSSETITSPIVTIGGTSVAATNVSGNNWSATYTILSTIPESIVLFKVSFEDSVGNKGADVSATSDNSVVLIDKTAPTVKSINRENPLSQITNLTTLVYRVVFSEAVKHVALPAFVLTTTGVATGVISSISKIAAETFDVTVNNVTAGGSIRLDLAAASNGITDSVGNPNTTGFTGGQTYSTNTPPAFVQLPSAASFTICQNSAAYSINSLLTVSEPNTAQTLTWTVSAAPVNGTLSGFNAATALSNGSSVVPTGLNYTPKSGFSGNDIFTVQVSDGYASTTLTINVTVNALPSTVVTASSTSVSKGLYTQLNVAAANITSYNWTPIAGLNNATIANPLARVTANTRYNVTVTNTAGCSSTDGIDVKIIEDIYLTPTIAFSPNGDGINEKFVIKNIDQYPNNKLQIYDRLGKLVYEQNNYANNWDGTIAGKVLAKDTYYYVLIVNNILVKKGAITIVR